MNESSKRVRSSRTTKVTLSSKGKLVGPTLIYRRTKKRRAVQVLLGHTKLESTVRYCA